MMLIGVGKQLRKGELEAMQQTIRFFETLLRASNDGIVITDPAQNIIVVNEAFCSFFGRRWREVIETNLFIWLEQLNVGAPQRWAELEKTVHLEGPCRDVEFHMRCPEPVLSSAEGLDGGATEDSVRYLSVNASLLERVADEEVGVIISIWRDIRAEKALARARDELEVRVQERTAELTKANEALHAGITGRKRVEEALRESEERFRMISELISDYAYVFRVKSNDWLVREWATEAFERITGYTPEELDAHGGWLSLVHPEDRDTAIRHRQAFLSGRESITEYRIITKNDDVFWLQDYSRPVWDEDLGRAVRVFGAAQDITERKRMESILAEERNLLRTLIDNLPDHIYVKDTESRFQIANKAVALTIGATTSAELVGKTDFDFLPAGLAERYYADEQMVIKSGRSLINREGPSRDSETGETIWFLTTTVPFYDSQGRIIGLVGIARDITERKRAEEELAEMALFAEMDPAPILRTDLDGTISLANRAAAELFKDQHLIGNSWYVLCLAVDRKAFDQLSHKGGTLQHEYRIGEKDFLFTYLSNLDYGLVHIYGTDITQLKQLEEQLLQSQKMKAIGLLAGGIAHDFSTLLGIILGYGDMMRDDVPEGCLLRDNIEEIIKAGYRAKALVKQILDFARPSRKTRRPIRLDSIVEDSLQLLRSSLSTTITIRQHIEAKSNAVLVDPTQIAQVIMNLGMNAGDAMGEQAGEIEITLIEAEVDTELAELQAVSPGSYVKLSVSDTGCGMSPKILERIFEPFFTTKDVGKGSGLGLSVVHGIVKSHGGFITVESKPGKGSKFQVYLPIIED